MKKNVSLLIMTVFLAVILAACGSNNAATSDNNTAAAGNTEATTAPNTESKELTIKHELGEITIKSNPQKVVVFDFGTLDTLDKLGVEVTGVPQSNVPSYLSKYSDAKYENVGGLKEPDFEKINSLSPDLIIISGRQQDSYDEFSKIAPTLYVAVDNANYMESFTKNVKTLGQIFGKEAEVETELTAINDSVKALNEKAKADGKKSLIILANEGKISAYGSGSRFGIIHDVFGFAQADDKIEVSTHGQSVSYEYVADKNPDYLFVVDRDAAVKSDGSKSGSAKDAVENDLVKNTNAFKNGKIIYLDPNYWYLSGGGLISVSEMLKEVEVVL
ncbi:iron complex transport system substrate-binding protein [Paenibacillus sp. PastF-3]|uniref:siderophore ABC transporter substrate-binding protein n=1 Tax=Paenibacillus TaxID=44249 RepID=UPI002475EF13|nr:MULTISPECIES: siderophore ABC transporter substrate-binding protein [unclassified Paenibacillus]MDH6374240.1 iron complex transport system substrate-binding protein [Paenibacillus sp. PastF-3]